MESKSTSPEGANLVAVLPCPQLKGFLLNLLLNKSEEPSLTILDIKWQTEAEKLFSFVSPLQTYTVKEYAAFDLILLVFCFIFAAAWKIKYRMCRSEDIQCNRLARPWFVLNYLMHNKWLICFSRQPVHPPPSTGCCSKGLKHCQRRQAAVEARCWCLVNRERKKKWKLLGFIIL